MKTLLVAMNSQYVHSNLAVWQLKACCTDECGEVAVKEYNINQQLKWILNDIVGQSPDVVAFSCYIWNIEMMYKLMQDVKTCLPDAVIIAGGPEISFDYEKILKEHGFIDYIAVGEGDETLPHLLRSLANGESCKIDGICSSKDIKPTNYAVVKDIDSLPSPYTDEMLESANGKIIYIETSRGCPFSCSYCLSQISHGVRYVSIEKVKQTLVMLENKGIKLLKFTDRTFNCNEKRALEIWRFAKENISKMKLHFEVGADLFSDEAIEFLEQMPCSSIQLEAGVQSTNEKTLSTVCRKTSLQKLFSNSRKILSFNNIHYHLDLIAGLPYEDYETFAKSFDDVYSLRPHQLQLGFLKMLKGSKIRREADMYNYKYRSYAPYEVISNDFLSVGDTMKLIKIEEALERYYNSGRFKISLPMIEKKFSGAFRMYEAIAYFLDKIGAVDRSVGISNQFDMLYDFGKTVFSQDEQELFADCLRADWAISGFKGKMPSSIPEKQIEKQFTDEFFKTEQYKNFVNSDFENKKEIMKSLSFHAIEHDVFSNGKKCEIVFITDNTNINLIDGRLFFTIIMKK